MTTTTTEPEAPRELRVPLTAKQAQHLTAIVQQYQQAETAMRAAVNLLTAGHVDIEFQQFRIEPDALVVIRP